MNLTEEQIADIKERQIKAFEYLKENGLELIFEISKQSFAVDGKLIFGDSAKVGLGDIKYRDLPQDNPVSDEPKITDIEVNEIDHTSPQP